MEENNVKCQGKKYKVQEKYLDLKDQNIKDIMLIEGLETLIDLEALNLGSNQITEIKGLDRLLNLKRLYLYDNQITEIKNLENLSNLEILELNGNEISEIIGLENLGNLKTITLNNNRIIEIKNLDTLRNLEILRLNFNAITEIKGLEQLFSLKDLELQGNKISEIKNITHLHNLVAINLEYNQIAEIKNLDSLQNLETLILNNNAITEIKGLEKLWNLEYLDLSKNLITEIKGLGTLQNLDYVNLDGNKISDPEMIYLTKMLDTQLIVDYCKFQEFRQCIPFIQFDKNISFDENLEVFRKELQDIDDSSVFINIGTHRELKTIESKQNALFLIQNPSEFVLQELDKDNFKDIIIHIIQIHSLKGIKLNSTKLEHFNFFINHFWDNSDLKKDQILTYNKEQELRVSYKLREFLNISIHDFKKPDIIIFPENSIPHNFVKELEEYSRTYNLIIVGGIEHTIGNTGFINKAIIIDKGNTRYQIKQTPVWIRDKENKKHVKENIKCESFPRINIFNTSLGRMAIFICKDFLRLSEIIPSWVKLNQVDFIIIPSLTTKVLPFQARLLRILNHSECKSSKFIFANIGEYSGSEMFSVEDNRRIEENYRLDKHDNIGEIIVKRKIKRIKSKYLELVDKEIEKCTNELEKTKKLKRYRQSIELNQIPFDLTKNLSVGWKDGEPYVMETREINILELLTKNKGFCIRCKKKIPFNRYKPYCLDDWISWVKWNNPFYIEKYCHRCGKPYETSKSKPFCDECYFRQ